MYPSWRYHRTETARIIKDPTEDEALGSDWSDTPATFLDQPAHVATEPPPPPAEPVKKAK